MSAAKKTVTATCAALVMLTLSACSEGLDKAGQKPVGKVNGTVITKVQLDRAVKALVDKNGGARALPPEKMQQVAAAALEQLTSAELLYQEGAKLEIKDLDKQVDAKFARTKGAFPSEAEFEKSLKSFQMTATEMKEAMRKEIVVNNFIRTRFASKVAISGAEARMFYDRNLDKLFRKGERIKASHILISVDAKALPEARSKAKAKAETILKRVRGGEDFATVARNESNCPSHARGGELGEFPRGQMAPPFEKAVFAMKPGEISSSVVQTELGYHVIKLAGKIPPLTVPFEEARGGIESYLKKDLIKKEIGSFVSGLRGKAKIEKS